MLDVPHSFVVSRSRRLSMCIGPSFWPGARLIPRRCTGEIYWPQFVWVCTAMCEMYLFLDSFSFPGSFRTPHARKRIGKPEHEKNWIHLKRPNCPDGAACSRQKHVHFEDWCSRLYRKTGREVKISDTLPSKVQDLCLRISFSTKSSLFWDIHLIL